MMMINAKLQDIVLDSNVLIDFLIQYYQNRWREKKYFGGTRAIEIASARRLNKFAAERINALIRQYEDSGASALIIVSALAFVEIGSHAEEMIKGESPAIEINDFRRFLSAFVDSPPEWFHIAPLDDSLFESLLAIPGKVELNPGDWKNIEWADSLHLATWKLRESAYFATCDRRLQKLQVEGLAENIIKIFRTGSV